MKPLISLLTLSFIVCPAISSADETASPSAIRPADSDLLRFSNQDTLHGSFISFGAEDSLRWKNSESPDPIAFATQKLHRITLNHGQAHKAIEYKSTVHLINGDVIPGVILSVDESSVTLKTAHLGKVTIPRDSITTLSTTPFGGKLLYYGPLNPDGWKNVSEEKPKEKPKAKDEEEEEGKKAADLQAIEKDTKKDDDVEEEEEKNTDWKYVANAWYGGSNKKTYLVRKNALPDQCRLSFKLNWRGTPNADIFLHADFAPPEMKAEETEKNSRLAHGSIPGHAYKLSITSHSASLSSLTYDDDGKLQSSRFPSTGTSLRLSGKDETKIEIRLDKKNKSILLFSDGSFIVKWDLGESYHGKGSHLAFSRSPYLSNAELRISDIAISHWNGMKDSAQSMTSKKRDVILLNNGLDRFSGTFKHIRDGRLSFEGTFNNVMDIPTNEVQEVHFATTKLKPAPETAKKAIYFYVYPYGRITGVPAANPNGNLSKTILLSDILGEVELDVRYINIIDFSHKNSLLDTWDDNF